MFLSTCGSNVYPLSLARDALLFMFWYIMMFINLYITLIPLLWKNMFLMSLTESWHYGDFCLFHVLSATSMDNKNIVHKIVPKCWDYFKFVFSVCPLSIFVSFCAVSFCFLKFSISQREIMKYANFYFHSQLFIICNGRATVLNSFKREKQSSEAQLPPW